jgi:hypothetical protein
VLTVAGRDASTVSHILRGAWDWGRLQVLTRNEPLLATHAHVSVMAHITLEELRARLTAIEAANGFANRFLFYCVQRSKKLPQGGLIDPANAAMLLIDHQSGLFQTIQDMPFTEVRTNAITLAKVASLAKIPVITGASVSQGPNGPLIRKSTSTRHTRSTSPAAARSTPGTPPRLWLR